MLEDEKGVEGAREFLKNLPLHTLFTLCQTITRTTVNENQEEAITQIIKQSPCLESILKRKCVTRDILVQYLHQRNMSISLNTVKQDLIAKTIDLWTDIHSTAIKSSQDNISLNQAVPESELQIMGKQFIGWFYPLLKNCGLTNDNFWENSELLVNLGSSDGDFQSTTFSGVLQVLNAFEQLIKSHEVILAPSVIGGCSAEVDSHGLVLITCSGTVHRQDNCVGVFQQMFSLTSDPFSPGDWRIKRSKLDVRVEAQSVKASKMPAIE